MLSKIMSLSTQGMEELLLHSNVFQKALPMNMFLGQKSSFSSNNLFLAAQKAAAAKKKTNSAEKNDKIKKDAEEKKEKPSAKGKKEKKEEKEEKGAKKGEKAKDGKDKKDGKKEMDDEEAKKRKAEKKQRDSALITIAVVFLAAAGVLGFREYKNGGLQDFSLSLAPNDKFKPKKKPKTEEEKEYYDALQREFEMIQGIRKNLENVVKNYDYKTKNSDIFESVKEELKSLEEEKNNINKLKLSLKQEKQTVAQRAKELKQKFEDLEKMLDSEKKDSKQFPVLKEKKLTAQRELAVTELLLQQKIVFSRILNTYEKMREMREYIALNQSKQGTKAWADNVYKLFQDCLTAVEKITENDKSQSQRWINLILGSDKTVSQRMSLDETIISEITLNRQRTSLLSSELNLLLLEKASILIQSMSGNPALSANLSTLIAKNYERQKKMKYQEERQLTNFLEAKKSFKADQDKLFIVKVFEALINKTQNGKKSAPKRFA